MFLVHARRVVNVRINFSDIIEVTMWCTFLSKKFLIRIKHQMKIEFLMPYQDEHDVKVFSKKNHSFQSYSYSFKFTNLLQKNQPVMT